MPSLPHVVSPELDPGDALRSVTALRSLADQVEDAAVAAAVRAGWSWPRIAEALGVTRQAVHKKHGARLRAEPLGTGKD